MRWCSVNFQCRGVLLSWTGVGQGPNALAVGAGGDLFKHFSLVYRFSFFLPLSLGDGPIQTEILSERSGHRINFESTLFLCCMAEVIDPVAG